MPVERSFFLGKDLSRRILAAAAFTCIKAVGIPTTMLTTHGFHALLSISSFAITNSRMTGYELLLKTAEMIERRSTVNIAKRDSMHLVNSVSSWLTKQLCIKHKLFVCVSHTTLGLVERANGTIKPKSAITSQDIGLN